MVNRGLDDKRNDLVEGSEKSQFLHGVNLSVEEKTASPDFAITLVRHGLTDYLHPYNAVYLHEDKDLTKAGELKSREYAKRLAKQLIEEQFKGEIAIISSPIVRAVHTARLYSEELQSAGLSIRKKGRKNSTHGVKTLEALTEVKHFNWTYFDILVRGGEILSDGQKYWIDPAQSNPGKLNHSDYFLFDGVDQIELDQITNWPVSLKKFANDFERHEEVAERVFKVFKRLEKGVGHLPVKLLLFTHDGSATLLMDMASGGLDQTLERGNYLTMKKGNEGLMIEEVMGQTVLPSKKIGDWRDYFNMRLAEIINSDKVR